MDSESAALTGAAAAAGGLGGGCPPASRLGVGRGLTKGVSAAAGAPPTAARGRDSVGTVALRVRHVARDRSRRGPCAADGASDSEPGRDVHVNSPSHRPGRRRGIRHVLFAVPTVTVDVAVADS